MTVPIGQQFPDEQWAWVTGHLPIACVDILPVVVTGGQVSHVGLIERDSPLGRRWCHVGGRIWYGETLREAGFRHLAETFDLSCPPHLDRVPFFVNEFFPQPIAGAGLDPRKHAVSVCYVAEISGTAQVGAKGEAIDFRWFGLEEIPTQQLWPGTEIIVSALPVARSESAHELAYTALNSRYISHNELMWQTPVLAMTAMAFLLTIALGDGRAWSRALAAMLSAAVALVSFQLMAKHSVNQLADADALWEIERSVGLIEVHGPPPAGRRQGWLRRFVNARLGSLVRLVVDGKSRNWWLLAMMLFGAVSLSVCLLALFGW